MPLASGDPASVRVELRTIVGGLSSPVFVTAPDDGSGRLFVVEQTGAIRIVRDGSLVDTPFLDLTDRVTSGGERGLLGLALEPGFGTAGHDRLYVNYTDRDGNTVIAEYRTSTSDANVADATSASVLLQVDQPFPNHNGGILAFGPDRMLYAGLGDGGSGGDPMGNGQRLDTDLGKILRLDPLGVAGTSLAPPDNAFVGRAGAKPEIWSYGLRNPWRFSFDRATGDLWIGDVGQGRWEEVDVARAADGGGRGLDFGWNRMEGAHCYPDGDSCDRSGLTLPVAEYAHDKGCAVVGGYVARAADAGPLSGVYLLSDNCSGTIWGLSSGATGTQSPMQLAPGGRSISSFGEDADGGILATDLGGGELLRVVGQPR
ncbi:MAG TPA: PQQ-dependent sugar dehydrogenase [Candidatus Limnocylindrales bacterium]|nr:PQQ-dependent sugar dehydrogenase [Candidatus Limnocylindrales bacterium]